MSREGGPTEGGLVGDPPAREGGSTEGGLVGDPPALAGGLANSSHDRRAGAQIAVRQVRADGRRARRLAVHERGALVRESGRRPKAGDCPAAPMEGGGGQGGMAGAPAWPAAGKGGERQMRRGHRDRHSDRTGGGSSGGVARTGWEEVGGRGGGARRRPRGCTAPYRCRAGRVERAGRPGDRCGAVVHGAVACPRRP